MPTISCLLSLKILLFPFLWRGKYFYFYHNIYYLLYIITYCIRLAGRWIRSVRDEFRSVGHSSAHLRGGQVHQDLEGKRHWNRRLVSYRHGGVVQEVSSIEAILTCQVKRFDDLCSVVAVVFMLLVVIVIVICYWNTVCVICSFT